MESPAPGRGMRLPALVSILILSAAGALWLAREDFGPLPEYGTVPDFSLTDARGRPATLADLRGKVWVATFIFTRCTETCPLQTAEMARLQAEFRQDAFRLVSISLDPTYDTPAVLARYAARYRADLDRWLFLTGEEKAVARLAREGFKLAFATRSSKLDPSLGKEERLSRLGAMFSPGAALAHHAAAHPDEISHSSRFVLMDRVARIRGYYHSDDPASLEKLRGDIRALLRG